MEPAIPTGGKHPVVGVALAAAAGILIADHWALPLWKAAALAVAALALWAVTRRTWTLLTFVAALFFLIHAVRFDHHPGRRLSEALGEAEITVTGTAVVDSVPTETLNSKGKQRSTFHVREVELEVGEVKGVRPGALLIHWPGAGLKIGDQLQYEGNLKNLDPPRNPGEFDYAAWLQRRDIFSQVAVAVPKNARVVGVGSPWNIRRWANDIKTKLAQIITRDLETAPLEAGIISAIVLGAKDETPDATKELFLKTGTLHLFSVSGLHVAMLAAITLFILTTLRVPRRVALVLTIPAVFTYALITGWSPASVRAAIMTSIFVVATLLDRPSLSINTLAVAFFVLLVSNTNQLFDTGFQLSFTVVAAIVLLSGSITRWLQTFTHPDPFIPRKLLTPLQKSRWLIANKLSGSVALTLAAWAGSLPLTAVYFNLMSPVAIVANLFILPIAFGILALGVLSVAFAWTGAWLSIAFNNASWACVNVLLLILSGCTALPHSSFFVGPHWWQLPHKQRITFFDLGAGGAALIETSGSCWLVDCGSDANYRRIVRAYLQKRGINHVDGIVLTHGDSSHIGGFEQFRKDFPDAAVYLPEAGRKSLGFRKVAIADVAQPLEAGTSLTLGREARMDVLWPGTRVDGGRADDHCLILRLILMDQTFLLTSDSGLSAEMDLLTGNNETAVRADWLVIGRHRDDPGGSEEFLQEVGAGRVLSTAARFPASEKVPPELAEICHKHHMQLLPFDKTGAVQVELESGRVEVKTFLKAPELQARKASSY